MFLFIQRDIEMRIFVIGCALFLSGCAQVQQNQEADRLLDMTKEDFASSILVKGDALDTSIEINTQNGFKEKRGLVGIVWDDNFLRAYIDKETGLTTYQVYDRIYMKDWSYFHTANYSTPDGLKSQDVIQVAADVESCSSNAFVGCKLREDVAWYVDRELLDTVAELYQPGQRTAWKYRLKSQQGGDRDRGFTAAEVAAFLEAVDAYKERHRLP